MRTPDRPQQKDSQAVNTPNPPLHMSPVQGLVSHQRGPREHRQRLRAVACHHARGGRRRRRGNAVPQRERRRNERARAGGQGQGSSHLKLHGDCGLTGYTIGHGGGATVNKVAARKVPPNSSNSEAGAALFVCLNTI